MTIIGGSSKTRRPRYRQAQIRRWRLIGGSVAIFILFLCFPWSLGRFYPDKAYDFPPSYSKLRKWEFNLPQHELDLPYPEGRNGKYVFFGNQILGLGWNNCLNEVLMNSWLAHESGRGYVFREYRWNREHYPWGRMKFRQKHPHTPLPALIAGPTAGGAWGPGDATPRSISEKWFNIVCPKSQRRIIHPRDVKPAVQSANGDVIFDHWKKILSEAPERCIEIKKPSSKEDPFHQIFDLWLWGSERVLPLWETFKNSPVSQLLRPSPLANSAVERNRHLFIPRGPRTLNPGPIDPFDRMIALHLRRGDYKTACLGFANWNSTFYSWNLLPDLPDRFHSPLNLGNGKSTPEGRKIYMQRCYPDVAQVMQKVRQAKEDFLAATRPGEIRTLDTIYLLTNDRTSWIKDLKVALQADGWPTIVTTNELELDAEQKDISAAVDMEFARRAAVFIGNGWSSYTSNVVHQRLVNGKETISTRFF